MARRYRRRSGSSGSGVQLIQIMGLGLLLTMILLFRDNIGDSAGDFFGALSSEDVQLPEETDKSNPTPVETARDAGLD